MSVGCCQLRNGVVWNADDCRRASEVVEAARAVLAVEDDRMIFPAFSDEKRKRRTAATERLRAALARYDSGDAEVTEAPGDGGTP